MPHSTYRPLPLDALYKLLENSVREMLLAYNDNMDGLIAFKICKKQVEVILEVIEEKKKEKRDWIKMD